MKKGTLFSRSVAGVLMVSLLIDPALALGLSSSPNSFTPSYYSSAVLAAQALSLASFSDWNPAGTFTTARLKVSGHVARSWRKTSRQIQSPLAATRNFFSRHPALSVLGAVTTILILNQILGAVVGTATSLATGAFIITTKPPASPPNKEKGVAVVGDTHYTRQVILALIEKGIPVVAWAADTDPQGRLSFLSSSTHRRVNPQDIELIGDPEAEFVLKLSGQDNPMELYNFEPGKPGDLSESGRELTSVLADSVGTVIADRPGMIDESFLGQKDVRVIVGNQMSSADESISQILPLPQQSASRIGKAFKEFADAQKAGISFAQLDVIEPNTGATQPRYNNPGASQMQIKKSSDYQEALRNGLGIEETKVVETLGLGYPIQQGTIMTVSIGLDRPVQARDIEEHFVHLAGRDGYFVVTDPRELLNTERMSGKPGVYVYGEPLVQTSEDGRSLIQLNFIMDPTETRVMQTIAAHQGETYRVPNPIQHYRETRADLIVTFLKRRILDAAKTDLAKVVKALTTLFGKKENVQHLKEQVLYDASNYAKLARFFHVNIREIKGFKKLIDPHLGFIGITVRLSSGEWIAASLASPQEPEAAPALSEAYYRLLRGWALENLGQGSSSLCIRDYYQPAEHLAAVWQIRSKNEAVLQKIIQLNENETEKEIANFNIVYPPLQNDELGVFVNGAGGRTGSTVARVLAGDAIDPSANKAQPLSGKTFLTCIGVQNSNRHGNIISGAEAFSDLLKTDSLVGPFKGHVRHGHENGGREDWVEVTPEEGKKVRVAVFSSPLFRDPANYPLGSFRLAGVPVAAFEGARTSNFATAQGLNRYALAGAQMAVVPNPGSASGSPAGHWDLHTFIHRVNSQTYHYLKRLISLASCTSSVGAAINLFLGLVGAMKVAGTSLPPHLAKEYQATGIGVGVTWHAYTQEGIEEDGSYDESEKAQGRSVASNSAYLGPTGYDKAVKMAGSAISVKGVALRGPWGAGSILKQVVDMPGHWTTEDMRKVFETNDSSEIGFTLAAEEVRSMLQMQRMLGSLASYHAVVDLSLVQIVHFTDNWGRPRSYISIPAFYENEWGFSVGVARFFDEAVRPAMTATAEELPLSSYPLRLSRIPEEGEILYADRLFVNDLSDEEMERRFKGKTVFARADFNVVEPKLIEKEAGLFEMEPEIKDEFRILAALPDIRRFQKAGARLVLASHNGRFQDIIKNKAGYSLEPVAKELSKHLGVTVPYSDETIGSKVRQQLSEMQDGDVHLLGNLRNHPGEEGGDLSFAEALVDTVKPDAYINLAFGAAHRGRHASIGPMIEALKQAQPGLPVIGGGIVQKELDGLKRFLNDPEAAESAVAVLGGGKVSDKIEVFRDLILNHRVKKIVLLGAMSMYFYMAQGKSVGNSFLEDNVEDVERSVQYAYDILRLAKSQGIDIVLPVGYRGTYSSIDKQRPVPLDPSQIHTAKIGNTGLPSGFFGYTVDQETVDLVRKTIRGAKWIISNGTAGVVEQEEFRLENDGIIEAIDEPVEKGETQCIYLGGDGVASFIHWARRKHGDDYLQKISKGYTLSTGGGATLELFARLSLSGLDPLDIKVLPKLNDGKISINGNLKWRIHTQEGVRAHLRQLADALKQVPDVDRVNIVVYVPSDLANDPELFAIVKNSPILLGVQNVKLPDDPKTSVSAAEVTAKRAAELGYRYIMIGHSNRREGTLTADYRPESDQRINLRLLDCLKYPDLTPLLLFGENEQERLQEIAGTMPRWEAIDSKLRQDLARVTPEQVSRIHFGYEPAWAIGKQDAGPLYAEVNLHHSRQVLEALYGAELANHLILGYGAGSNERNANAYLARQQVQLLVPGRPAAEPRSFALMAQQMASFAKGMEPRKEVRYKRLIEAFSYGSLITVLLGLASMLLAGLHPGLAGLFTDLMQYSLAVFGYQVGSMMWKGIDIAASTKGEFHKDLNAFEYNWYWLHEKVVHKLFSYAGVPKPVEEFFVTLSDLITGPLALAYTILYALGAGLYAGGEWLDAKLGLPESPQLRRWNFGA